MEGHAHIASADVPYDDDDMIGDTDEAVIVDHEQSVVASADAIMTHMRLIHDGHLRRCVPECFVSRPMFGSTLGQGLLPCIQPSFRLSHMVHNGSRQFHYCIMVPIARQ